MNAPFDVSRYGLTLLLCQRCHDRRDHLTGHLAGVDALFLELDTDAKFLEFPDGRKTIFRISSESGNAFDQNTVDFSFAAVSHHALEILAFFDRRAGDTLVGINVDHFPIRIAGDEFGIIFNAEHPFYCTGVNDKASWALKESILPAFRYITEKPAASRDAVAAEIKAGIFTSNKTYLPQNYAAGLYGNTSDTNILQYSGRYRVLPLFTNRVQESDVPAHIWNNKLYVSDFNGKTDAYKQGKLNPLYPEVSTGDAFVETLLGGNERWLVMNSSFNDNTNQTAGIIPATAAFASSMNFTLTPHTYLVVEQDTDSLSIELNNFRTDKDELWVAGKSSNPDWTSYGTDWNGDNKLYVQEYMNYHIDNPKLDKRDTERYDLRDTVISLSVSNQPI